jgi:hypothetical protein
LARSGLLREPAGADFKRVDGEGESGDVRSPEDLAPRNNSAITHLVLLKDYHRNSIARPADTPPLKTCRALNADKLPDTIQLA